MKELVEAINRLAAAQEESNKISKLNTELLQNMLLRKKAQISSICREDKDNKNNL